VKLLFSLLLLAAGLAWGGGAEAPRAARSVHLGYSAAEGDVFYNEMVVEESVNGSYFMACGWDTGYFGIQQLNHETNKVVIFSVWDPTKGDDAKAVKTEDRVENLFAGEGVRIKRFGGEGTGGQSMAPFHWRAGETNRFVIQSEVQSNKTAYTGWIFDRAKAGWWKLATFRTRTGGRNLRGYYSFVEDFRRDTRSVNEVRRARFGNGWVRTVRGEWVSLNAARFTASNATWESKENIDAGTVGDRFFLTTGGATQRTFDLKGTLYLRANAASRRPDLPF
jgi:hypothetical protein